MSAALTSGLPAFGDGTPEVQNEALKSLNYEIRTPLSGILGMADLLLESNLNEAQRAHVSALRLCAQDIHQVLDATLEYAAPSAERTAAATAFDPAALIESVVDEQRPSAEGRRLELRCYVDAGLPQTVIGDAARLRQAAAHAFSGVIRLSQPGPLNIHLSARPADNRSITLRLVISEAAWEAAHETHASTAAPHAPSRLGIGLALAERLLAFIGGTVRSETNADGARRTTLAVLLKLAPADGSAASGKTGPAPRILLVEDNDVFQTVVRHMLRRHDLQLDCASNGVAAIEAARLNRYDLILMDLRMPDMSGFAAADEIRRLPGYEATPILAITANASEEFRSLSAAHGMKEFLSKPISSADLVGAIRKWLSGGAD